LIKVFKVLPDETSYGGVLRNSFERSVDGAIFGFWAFDWSVVDIGDSDMGNFGL
jgi:hypothetical protein